VAASSIQVLAKKLRMAADLLDELGGAFGPGRRANENGETAALIRGALKKNGHKRHANFGHRYNGTHWTQQPENRAKVIANARGSAKTRRRNAKRKGAPA
jgi:hypothetical protein